MFYDGAMKGHEIIHLCSVRVMKYKNIKMLQIMIMINKKSKNKMNENMLVLKYLYCEMSTLLG